MNDILAFLQELTSTPGISGFESPVSKLIREKWAPLLDEIHDGNIGSLHGMKQGSKESSKYSVMVAAHMDAIGLMITDIVDGFLRFTSIGGVDPRVLPGQPVFIHASGSNADPFKPIYGQIVQPSNSLLPDDLDSNVVPIENLFIDSAISPDKIQNLINIGDIVSFGQEPLTLNGDSVAAHSLDNRASVAALTICLEDLKTKQHEWDVWAAATVQEEEGLVGGYTSSYQLRPSLAVVVDTTWAKGPGSDDWNTFPMGKGPTLMFGPNIQPKLHQTFKELAEKLEIPYSIEITGRSSGTDGYATQVVAGGIPTMVIGIPIRYMHTPVEVVALKDIQRTGRLLSEFISYLDDDFLETIELDS